MAGTAPKRQATVEIADESLKAWSGQAQEILQTLAALPGNQACFDCGSLHPTWASLNLAILMCLECSGQHRALGVHRSTVRSVELDTWPAANVDAMLLGSNQQLHGFFLSHGVDPDAPITVKYATPAAELYRRRLAARKQGLCPPTELSRDEIVAIEDEAVMEAKQAERLRASQVKPEWTADHQNTACEICRDKFTFLNRRHHCRKCGKLVCAACAPKDNAKPLPQFGIVDAVRHCKLCFRAPTVAATKSPQQRVGKM